MVFEGLSLGENFLSLSNKDSVIQATLLLVGPMAQQGLAKWLEDFGREISGRLTKWLKKYAQQCEKFSGKGT